MTNCKLRRNRVESRRPDFILSGASARRRIGVNARWKDPGKQHLASLKAPNCTRYTLRVTADDWLLTCPDRRRELKVRFSEPDSSETTSAGKTPKSYLPAKANRNPETINRRSNGIGTQYSLTQHSVLRTTPVSKHRHLAPPPPESEPAFGPFAHTGGKRASRRKTDHRRLIIFSLPPL
jgi:hypothetical protein